MNNLVNFQTNEFLFKCDMDEFNVVIKSVLTKIISTKTNRFYPCAFYNVNNHAKCVICLQYVRTKYTFAICKNCVKTCLQHDIGPFIFKRWSCHKKVLLLV